MKTRAIQNPRYLVPVACMILAMLTLVAAANEKAVPLEPGSKPVSIDRAPGVTLVTMTDEQALKLSPMHQDLRRVLIEEKTRLADLYEEFEKETDSRRALVIQGEINEVKTGTAVSLLEIQAKVAREDGRLEDALQLEEGIQRLVSPDWGSSSTAPRTERESSIRK